MTEVSDAPMVVRAEPQVSSPAGAALTALRRLREAFGRHQSWLMVAGPTLLMLVLGYRRAAETKLWLDELATWSIARRDWSDLIAVLKNLDAVHAPYYIFMHFWISIFGESEIALRAPSILAMSAAAGFVVALGRRLFGTAAGLCAGVVFSLIPTVTNMAQFARDYSLSIMFAVWATLALVAAIDKPTRWRWAGYCVLVFFTGAFHLIALLLLIAHGLLILQRVTWAKKLALLWWWLATVACAIAAISPIIYLGLGQKSQILAREVPQASEIPAFVGEMFGTTLIAGVLIGLAVASQRAAFGWVTLLAAWAIIPPGVVFLVSYVLTSHYHAQSYWEPRYVLFCLPAIALMVGVSLSNVRIWFAALVLALGIVISVQPFIELRGADASQKVLAAQFLAQHIRTGDVAVYNPGELWGPRDFIRYYVPSSKQPKDILAAKTVEESGQLIPPQHTRPEKYLRDQERVWVIRHGNYQHDPVIYLGGPEQFLRQNFHSVLASEFDGITIALLEPNEPAS